MKGNRRRRWFAMGDPQAPFDKLQKILAKHELVDDKSGRLKDDVGLVSIGDHFDFKANDAAPSIEAIGREGMRTLDWLAAHPNDQVVILMGNHDAARVMELAYETDETFREAREHASKCGDSPTDEETRAFCAKFEHIPTLDVARRDYCSFTVEQRNLVQRLLLEGNMYLACIGQRGDTRMLMTHAGVTNRDLDELSLGSSRHDLDAVAAGLETRLRSAIDRVRLPWEHQERMALDLGRLHVPGRAGKEGGGLLYHRPSSKKDEDARAPRRFDPREELPRGLVQVCGHSGHHKCLKELAPWATDKAKKLEHGGLRVLTVNDAKEPRYDLMIPNNEVAAPNSDATMYMIDAEMNAPEVSVNDYPLFALDRVTLVVPATE